MLRRQKDGHRRYYIQFARAISLSTVISVMRVSGKRYEEECPIQDPISLFSLLLVVGCTENGRPPDFRKLLF